MPTIGIESNGRLEKTAVYFNGEQIAGIKELLLNIDENGTFDTVIKYEGADKNIYTKNLFEDYLENVKTVPPTFTDDDANELVLFSVDSDGDVESTKVFINDIPEEGIVSLFVHIKTAVTEKGIKQIFAKDKPVENSIFTAQISFRYEDDSIETEDIF